VTDTHIAWSRHIGIWGRAQGSSSTTSAGCSNLGSMTASGIRVTLVIMDVLDVIMSAPQDDLAWGLRICEMTGRGPGTTYPALDRLMKAGWIEDHWEDPVPSDRPRRRFYTVTSVGRAGYANAREDRARRRLSWAKPGVVDGVAWALPDGTGRASPMNHPASSSKHSRVSMMRRDQDVCLFVHPQLREACSAT